VLPAVTRRSIRAGFDELLAVMWDVMKVPLFIFVE